MHVLRDYDLKPLTFQGLFYFNILFSKKNTLYICAHENNVYLCYVIIT